MRIFCGFSFSGFLHFWLFLHRNLTCLITCVHKFHIFEHEFSIFVYNPKGGWERLAEPSLRDSSGTGLQIPSSPEIPQIGLFLILQKSRPATPIFYFKFGKSVKFGVRWCIFRNFWRWDVDFLKLGNKFLKISNLFYRTFLKSDVYKISNFFDFNSSL